MKDKKYVLTDKTKEIYGHILHRIKAVKDFGDVKKDDLGGWIETEYNLSQFGNCWIYDNAIVCENANVRDNAIVCGNAIVYGEAYIWDNAKVRGSTIICDKVNISEYACIRDYANVYGRVSIRDYTVVRGNAKVHGEAIICGDAKIESDEDYAVFKNTWSSGRYFTWTRSNNKWKVGCFYGSGEELIAKAYADNEKKGKCYEAIVKAQELISNIK